MHKKDLKESSNFDGVVEAGGRKVQVLELESLLLWLSVQVPSLMSTFLPPASTTPSKFELFFKSFCALLDYLFLLFEQVFIFRLV